MNTSSGLSAALGLFRYFSLTVLLAFQCAGPSGAAGILEAIKEHNQLWLAPFDDPVPEVSYTIRYPERSERVSTDKFSELSARRGVAISIPLDDFLAEPKRYRVKRRYEGKWEGKDVVVVDVMDLQRQGLVGTPVPTAVIVVDKATSRPLVLDGGDTQHFFLNYVQARADQHVPLRIVLGSKGWFGEDYRFQLADGRVWLSEKYSYYRTAFWGPIENIRIDGRRASKIRRAVRVKPLSEFKEFNLNSLTDLRGETEEERLVVRILERNRAWLAPSLDHLESVTFLHRVEPPLREDQPGWRRFGIPAILGAERFVWRKDGTALVEVLPPADSATSSQWWLRTAGSEYFYHPFNDRFAHPKTKEAKDTRRFPSYFHRYLKGSPLTFGLLEWARNPQDWGIKSIIRQPDENAYKITIAPLPRDRGPTLNVGVIFYGKTVPISWSFSSIRETDVYVDGESLLPIETVDFLQQNQAVLRFSDYQDVGDERSVPRSIQLVISPKNFQTQYQFEWRPERLWILKAAESRSMDKNDPPHVETISDLKINQPIEPFVADNLALAEKTQEILAFSDSGTSRPIAAFPFQLGRKILLPEAVRTSATPQIRDILFTLDADENLVADLGLDGGGIEPTQDDRLVLALFDESARPIGAFQAPLAAAAFSDRPASPTLEAIRAHNAFWLAPDLEAFPAMSYESCFNDTRTTKVEPGVFDPARNREFPWGVAMNLGLEEFLARPNDYRVPILFEARWNDRDVVVAAIAGPGFDTRWGWGDMGYSYFPTPDDLKTKGLLVIEKATSKPLVCRYGDTDIHFLNYTELRPGQYAPFRIVSLPPNRSWASGDFRFQIVDGRRWLFDCSVQTDGRVNRRIRNLRIDGTTVPVTRWTGAVTSITEIAELDASRITARRNLDAPGYDLIESVIERPVPWEHPDFDALLDVHALERPAAQAGRIRLNLGRSRVLGHSAFATLHRFHSAGSRALGYAGETKRRSPLLAAQIEIPTYPFRLDETIAVNAPDKIVEGTFVKRLNFRTNAEGELLAGLEIVTQAGLSMFDATASVILLDEEDNVIAARSGRASFATDLYTVEWKDVVLNFGRLAEARPPKRFEVGLKSHVTGWWGSSFFTPVFEMGPLFPVAQHLNSDDPRHWIIGLKQLDENVRGALHYEVFEDSPHVRDQSLKMLGGPRTQQLRPHNARLVFLLGEAKSTETLAYLCRLLGHSGEPRFRKYITPFLSHPRASVRDAAAVGLGLLGDASGLERLDPILARPVPEKHPEGGIVMTWQIDAALALGAIGSEPAVDSLGRFFLSRVDAAIAADKALVPVHGLKGEEVAHILGHTENHLALKYLREAVDRKSLDSSTLRVVRYYIDARTSSLSKILRKVGTRIRSILRGP